MAKATVTENEYGSATPDLELDEYYHAKVFKTIDKDSDYGPDPIVVLVLRIVDEDKKELTGDDDLPYEITKVVNVKANSGKRSMFYNVCDACLYGGQGVPEGEELDSDNLVGKYCRFLWGKVVNPRDHTEKPGIVKFAPFKTRSSLGAKTRAAAMEAEVNEL